MKNRGKDRTEHVVSREDSATHLTDFQKELKGLSTEDLYDKGIELIEDDDQIFFEQCLVILRERATRKISAAKWLGHLLEEYPPKWRGGKLVKIFSPIPKNFTDHVIASTKRVSATDLDVILGKDIEHARIELIKTATRKIVLSTYSIDWHSDRPLWKLLSTKSKGTPAISVEVYVDWREYPNRKSKGKNGVLQELEQDDVKIIRLSENHSKILIVDDSEVLIGSGNAEKCRTDAAIRLKSPEAAKVLDSFLRESLKRFTSEDSE